MITSVTAPDQPDPAAVAALLPAVEPGLRLARMRPLTGGVSAAVTRIDAVSAAGQRRRLVLRQYGPANLRSDPHAAVHEHDLLGLLRAAGLPVPAPRYADESRAILPVPFVVVDFIDGQPVTEPPAPPGLARQLAAVLARLHTSGPSPASTSYLADIRDRATRKIETRPSAPDEPLQETAIRAALSGHWPPPAVNRPVVLHGDYWPGNTLWSGGQLVAVIDWEDAAVGDPLADVATARMELSMVLEAGMAADFTAEYRTLRPDLDWAALPHWDLYAALRHAGRLEGWGLSAAKLDRFRAGHREFAGAALTAVGRTGPRAAGPG
jgi:aminoglycoside phosphotransferase (APT) family kinase protein